MPSLDSATGIKPALRDRAVYAAVAAVAVVVHLGALWNRFAVDDLPIIANNPLVASLSGVWRAFATSYWPPGFGGWMYRPLPVATYALDAPLHSIAWFHFVNLVWHAGASVAVALLARRLADARAALIAGLLFAVHPVHVEAVANVVGRAEIMAALFVVLGVYAALVHRSVAWSAAAWGLGLLCKENAAVLPGLVVWGWMLGFGVGEGKWPPRARVLAFAATWVVVGAAYAVIRAAAIPHNELRSIGPIFLGTSRGVVRLTAIAALADVARLLCFPLTLRVDYSPAEYTAVWALFDPRLAWGLGCALVWAGLLIWAWRRGRRVEAFGLGWIGIAFLPVANLVFPAGFLIAERTLYLPSVGIVLAAGAWLASLGRAARLPVLALVILGGVRSALRVPVWRDNDTVTLSILEDSPRSYVGPRRMIGTYLDHRQPARALDAARTAAAIFPRDPNLYVTGAVAGFAAGQPAAADTLLARLDSLCRRCFHYYREEAETARRSGYGAAADSLLAHVREAEKQTP
jgi:protein O-mannosyl-transferase